MTDTKTFDVTGGRIRAAIEGDLVVAQGIYYAKQKRFRPPMPVEPWQSTLDCTKPGPIGPQADFNFPPLEGVVNLDRPKNEDCLLVNVVAPTNAKDLPVAVWFTGGAYINGYADLAMYNTRPLARHGLVMINVQYRIGILGYATIPGVSEPNIGLQDQIAGLRWVQENCAAFGGDPSRVTIYGQSAGGDSVYGMLLADGTEGLFQQAIMISAPFGIFVTEKPESEILMRTLDEKLAGKDLLTVPTEQLLDVQTTVIQRRAKAGVKGPGFLLTHGAAPLPSFSQTAARLAERAKKIPVLIGWTRDDALPFVYLDSRGSMLPKIPLIGSTLFAMVGRLQTYIIFSRGAQQLHTQYKQLGGRSSTYCVEYYPDGSSWLASHCMEMPLLFGDYDYWKKTPLLGPAHQQSYEKLADTFKQFFVDFFKGQTLTADHYRVHKDFIYKSGNAKL